MRYRFGDFELDTRAYRLTRAGLERKVQPKVFEVLTLLVQRAGQVVTKQELLETLWPGEHVGDATVTWSVSFARRALDQGRGDKLPIETIHARGYRFGAEVAALHEASPSTPPPTASPSAPAPHPNPAPALPFVGREPAMRQLHAHLDEAALGRGRACALVGEAGIGKTRCSEELTRTARARGFHACIGRATELAGAPAFLPWRQVVLDLRRSDPSAAPQADAVLALLGKYDAPPADAAPERRRDDGGSERFALFEALAELLRQASMRTPVLLVFDDMHWADTGTLEALAVVAPIAATCPLLLLVTQRDEADDGNRRSLQRVARVTERISLTLLSTEDVASYIAQVEPSASPSPALCLAIQRATAGNPLFVQELVRGLLETHGARGLSRLDPAAVSPPRVARDLLRIPVAALDPDTRRLLGQASVLGDTFELSLLQEVAQLDPDTLLDRVEAALRSEMLIAEAPHRHRFRHALLRAVLYDDLPAKERVGLHRRAADALAARADGAVRPAEEALHLYRSLAAGDVTRVADAAVRAAHGAERARTYDAAATFYEWALHALELDASAGPRRLAELLLACGDAQRAAGRDERGRKTVARAIELSRTHGFGDLLARAARALRPIYTLGTLPDPLARDALEAALACLPPTPDRARVSVLSQLACVPPIAHDLSRSKSISEEALTHARLLGEHEGVLEALRARMYALSGPDDLDALLAVCDEVASLDAERSWLSGEAHAARYATALTRGDAAAASAALHALEHTARHLGRMEGQWYAARLRAQHDFQCGAFDAAVSACTTLVPRARHIGLSYGPRFIQVLQTMIWRERIGVQAFRAQLQPALEEPPTPDMQHGALAFRARLLCELDLPELARPTFTVLAAHEFDDIPRESSYVSALCHLAAVCIALEDAPRARLLLERLAPYAHLHAVDLLSFCHGPVAFYVGKLRAFLDPRDSQASSLLEQAARASEAMGHRPLAAHAALAHGQLLLGLGTAASVDAGREQLTRALGLAEHLGMQVLAERIRVDLARSVA